MSIPRQYSAYCLWFSKNKSWQATQTLVRTTEQQSCLFLNCCHNTNEHDIFRILFWTSEVQVISKNTFYRTYFTQRVFYMLAKRPSQRYCVRHSFRTGIFWYQINGLFAYQMTPYRRTDGNQTLMCSCTFQLCGLDNAIWTIITSS